MPVCVKCQAEVDSEDLYVLNGQEMCEDCALKGQQQPKPCDVWAVRMATNTRKSQGQTGAEGLTEMQKAIYDFPPWQPWKSTCSYPPSCPDKLPPRRLFAVK